MKSLKPLNPLFVDSTKAFGDKALSHVQLTDLKLNQGESLFFEIVEATGLTQKIIMKPVETKKTFRYQTEVWTEADKSFQYRFWVTAEGRVRGKSPLQKTASGKNIVVRWDPIWMEERESEGPIENHPPRPLIEPQTSEKMKLLLKELS